MTIGIGGWGSRRKPMAAVRAILRSDLTDLTVVSYGGPDVGLLCAAGKVAKVVFGFVTLDSIPTDPHFKVARQTGGHRVHGDRRGHVLPGPAGRVAAAFPSCPPGPGWGPTCWRSIRRCARSTSPYDDGEELVAMPALRLDAALVHVNRADAGGSGQILGPDPVLRRALPRRRRAPVHDHRADRRHRPVRRRRVRSRPCASAGC